MLAAATSHPLRLPGAFIGTKAGGCSLLVRVAFSGPATPKRSRFRHLRLVGTSGAARWLKPVPGYQNIGGERAGNQGSSSGPRGSVGSLHRAMGLGPRCEKSHDRTASVNRRDRSEELPDVAVGVQMSSCSPGCFRSGNRAGAFCGHLRSFLRASDAGRRCALAGAAGAAWRWPRRSSPGRHRSSPIPVARRRSSLPVIAGRLRNSNSLSVLWRLGLISMLRAVSYCPENRISSGGTKWGAAPVDAGNRFRSVPRVVLCKTTCTVCSDGVRCFWSYIFGYRAYRVAAGRVRSRPSRGSGDDQKWVQVAWMWCDHGIFRIFVLEVGPTFRVCVAPRGGGRRVIIPGSGDRAAAVRWVRDDVTRWTRRFGVTRRARP